MAKNKLHKYERVKFLPNVTFSSYGESRSQNSYPWNEGRCKDMEKILELGCGKGEHSLAFAAANPGRLFMGIDSKSHRLCVGAEKAIAHGLENIHFLCTRIEALKDFFDAHSIHEIWLTFPDPHPKKRAVKNRLTAPSFLSAYAHILKPGGTVNLKTDSDLLYTYTRESVKLWGGQLVATSENIHGTDSGRFGAPDIVSAFEKTANTQGIPIKYMAFTL